MVNKKGCVIASATLAEKNTNTTKEISLVVFLSLGTYERLPPGGSWRHKATEGKRVIMRSIQIPSLAGSFHRYRGPFLAAARSRSGSDTTLWCHSRPSRRFATSRREAFACRSSADSGFGLLPDGAWTSTRYACPRRKRRESEKTTDCSF